MIVIDPYGKEIQLTAEYIAHCLANAELFYGEGYGDEFLHSTLPNRISGEVIDEFHMKEKIEYDKLDSIIKIFLMDYCYYGMASAYSIYAKLRREMVRDGEVKEDSDFIDELKEMAEHFGKTFLRREKELSEKL